MKNLYPTMVSSMHTLGCFGALLVLSGLVTCSDPCPPNSLVTPYSCSCTSVDMGKLMALFAGIEPAVARSMSVQPTESSVQNNEVVTPRSLDNLGNETKFRSEPMNSFYTVVKCRAPQNLLLLVRFVTFSLQRKWVDKFEVSKLPPQIENKLVRLPHEWLKNMRVKQFEVRDTFLSGDFISYNNPFQGQEHSLVWFTAKNCYLSGALSFDSVGTVFTKGLNTLRQIEGIDFSRNQLSYIFALAFKYPPANLTTINLSYNSIEGIENGAFAHVPKLKHVDLKHNLLTGVSRTYFASPARALEHIDLSWNLITSLPVDFFNNMPNMKVVNMSKNFLYSIPDRPWAAVWTQLTFVDVTDNFVECDCSLMWLLDIQSPPEVYSVRAPPPHQLPGQTVLGFCSQTHPQLFTKNRLLVDLTRSDLNC